MARFVMIGYGDRKGYERTDPAVREAAHDHDEQLRSQGVTMGVAHQAAVFEERSGQLVLPFARLEFADEQGGGGVPEFQ